MPSHTKHRRHKYFIGGGPLTKVLGENPCAHRWAENVCPEACGVAGVWVRGVHRITPRHTLKEAVLQAAARTVPAPRGAHLAHHLAEEQPHDELGPGQHGGGFPPPEAGICNKVFCSLIPNFGGDSLFRSIFCIASCRKNLWNGSQTGVRGDAGGGEKHLRLKSRYGLSKEQNEWARKTHLAGEGHTGVTHGPPHRGGDP